MLCIRYLLSIGASATAVPTLRESLAVCLNQDQAIRAQVHVHHCLLPTQEHTRQSSVRVHYISRQINGSYVMIDVKIVFSSSVRPMPLDMKNSASLPLDKHSAGITEQKQEEARRRGGIYSFCSLKKTQNRHLHARPIIRYSLTVCLYHLRLLWCVWLFSTGGGDKTRFVVIYLVEMLLFVVSFPRQVQLQYTPLILASTASLPQKSSPPPIRARPLPL